MREIGAVGATEARTTDIALGFTLIAAFVTGEVLRRFRLPRLTGYLLFGLVMGPYLANLITESMAQQLQTIRGLATTFIALIAGLMINLERLGSRVVRIARMTAVTVAISVLGVFAVVWVGWSFLPIASDATGLTKLAMASLLAISMITFSPTMSAAVIAETGARGRLSDLVLTMVVLSDVVIVVMFSLGMQFARVTFGASAGTDVNVLVRLAWEIGGAVAFGSFVGALFALYLRYIGREVTLVLLAVCGLLSQVGSTQQFEPLLAAVAAGLVIENLSVAQGDALRAAVQRGAPPVLVIFFVAIGSSLRVDALTALGPIALALAAIRAVLIRAGVWVGLTVSDVDRRVGEHAWTGLISQ